jgi:beta-glucosidase/6-phospho-beta-glucosidase/beta-galactosidase
MCRLCYATQWFEAAGGFTQPDNLPAFEAYCQLVFQEFGHRIPYWATFNEPSCFSLCGYIMVGHLRRHRAAAVLTVQLVAARSRLLTGLRSCSSNADSLWQSYCSIWLQTTTPDSITQSSVIQQHNTFCPCLSNQHQEGCQHTH